jgi:hypothetical protein
MRNRSSINNDVRKVRTVRELGGEIYSELYQRVANEKVSWQVKTEIVDIIMGVLARHAGSKIENDEGLPVTPLE